MKKFIIINNLIEILKKYDCYYTSNLCFYYDNKRISKCVDEQIKKEEIDINDYLEYWSKDDYYIFFTFEAKFYDVINYGDKPECFEEFYNFLEKNDLYYELGDYWNMMIRPIER